MDRKAKGDAVRFTGYGSVWGRVDSYGDTIIKGAFAESIKARRPMMLFGHSPGRVPGKWIAVEEDDKGLLMTGELTPGHSEAADIEASLRHASLNGLSIGGYSLDWETQKDGGRVIRTFDLYEVSIVSMPAEQEARIDTASVKSALDDCRTIADLESLLREAAGLSKTAATAVTSKMARILRGEPAGNDSASRTAGELLDVLKTTNFPNSILQG